MSNFLEMIGDTVANGTADPPKGAPPVDIAAIAQKGMAIYRAPSLLQPHRMREAIQDAHNGRIPPLQGFFFTLTTPQAVRFIAQLGFDIIGVDWEHSPTNVETMTQMVHDIQYLSEGRSVAMVRVPGHGHAEIGNALDAGAGIIMVPQVETVSDAKHVVGAMRFGTAEKGSRSAPPARYVMGVSDISLNPTLTFHQNLNAQASLTIQIESLAAINNLDDILTECGDGIDAVWLGSLDVRVSMGLVGFAPGAAEPEWVKAVAKFESILHKHNKPLAGFVMGDGEVRQSMGKGKAWMFTSFDMLSYMNTMGELAGARQAFPAQSKVGAFGKS